MSISSKNFSYLEKVCLTIARKECPVDTGNMRDNAIYLRKTNQGFQIIWDNQFAYYLPIVDKNLYVQNADIALPEDFSGWETKGTKQANLGFVNRTFHKLNEICQGYINNPNEIYKQYANRKIDLNSKVLQRQKEYDEKFDELMSKGENIKARRLLKRLYNDPGYRRFLVSQILEDFNNRSE